MAFISKTTKRDKTVWRIVWNDATRGPGKLGRRFADCRNGSHAEAFDAAALPPNERAALANGAATAVLRDRLRRCYEALERSKNRDGARASASGKAAAFDTPMVDLIDAYLQLVEYRQAKRTANAITAPSFDPGWRMQRAERPLKPSAAKEMRRILGTFKEWLPRGLRAGELSAETLSAFLSSIARSASKGGSKTPGQPRAPRTINKYRTILRGFLFAFTGSATERYFRFDPHDAFADEVEALPVPRHQIETYKAAQVVAFLDAAEKYADPARAVSITRTRKGKVETFTQGANPSAPIVPLALTLACTGMRLSEAMSLKWSGVDLDSGVVTIFAGKNEAHDPYRYLPLTGEQLGDIAPLFLDLLRAWRKANPGAEYVLPLNGATVPAFPKHTWAAVANLAKQPDVTPQGLRRTFESVLAMVGFPSRLTSFWLGHSTQVAERHYLAFTPGRRRGSTIEAVLGLEPFIRREIARAEGAKARGRVGSKS